MRVLPMKRTAIKRSTKRMKSRGPKMTPIRASARNQDCTLRIPGICNRNPETTVWCHSNESIDGKGAGLKARDVEGCYGCSTCHKFYDGGYINHGYTRDEVRRYFNAARVLSRSILEMKGLLK